MSEFPYDEYYDDDEPGFDFEDCGQAMAEEGECALVGTEYCDFFCQFSKWMYEDAEANPLQTELLDDLPGLAYGTTGDADALDQIPFEP